MVPPHRRAIAARLSRAATVPQFTVSRTVDAQPALARAAGLDGVTLTHVLLQATAAALRAVPHVNRVWLDDGPRFLRLAHCHVGLAIATDDNLIVAASRNPTGSASKNSRSRRGGPWPKGAVVGCRPASPPRWR